jgi:cellulose biosynthesis protein BcsQ
MQIISVINQKGGVGKTTTVINLAAGLTQLNKKILVIDLDPQGNATTGLGLSNIDNSSDTIYGVLNGTRDINDIIKKTQFEGLTQLMKTIERIKVSLNPDLKIRGILLTMYDKRNKLSSQVEKEARDYFNEKVYSTVIPRNVRLSEAPSHGMPVLIYDKSCPGSKSYFSFTDEFINQESTFGSAA